MKSAPDFTVWHGKPYYSLGTGGCIFCRQGGSGEFAVSFGDSDPAAQLKKGIRLLHAKKTGNRVIAYFQAYTNTYGPTDRLRTVYEAALKEPFVCGISIATRPDCLGEAVLELLDCGQLTFP